MYKLCVLKFRFGGGCSPVALPFHLGCASVWKPQRDFSQDSSTCPSYQADRYVFQPSTDRIFSSKHKPCLIIKKTLICQVTSHVS